MSHLEWLQEQGEQLYWAGGLAWRLYRRAPVPAPISPTRRQSRRLSELLRPRPLGAETSPRSP